MLDRAPSPDAIRARASRARLKRGVRTFKVRAHARRLVAAMRTANPRLPESELSPTEIEAELQSIIDAFCQRWLVAKRPFA